jgi:hypothetical protein
MIKGNRRHGFNEVYTFPEGVLSLGKSDWLAAVPLGLLMDRLERFF